MTTVSRRRFLTLATHAGWATAVSLFLYQIGRFLGARGLDAGPPPAVVAGPLDAFPPGQPIYAPEARAWIVRSETAVDAFDAVCPHLGCLVRQEATGDGFYCPCHGSRFASDGALQLGPAERPLRRLETAVRDGEVVVRLD